MYHFRKLNRDNMPPRINRLMLDSTKRRKFEADGRLGVYMAEFRGALLRLFGDADMSSSVAEEAYEYILEATDDHGGRWLLTAYHGPSGPAIGGNATDRAIYPVAQALLELIEATEPADFEMAIYDGDTDHTIILGCNSGECYAHSLPGDHLPPE